MPYAILFVSLLFLTVAVIILYVYNIPLLRRLPRAVVRMLINLGITAACLHGVFAVNHWGVSLLWILLMVVLSAALSVNKAQLKLSRFFVPALAGVGGAVLIVGVLTLLAITDINGAADARFLIPVAGILVGSLIETNGRALRVYYSGLDHHSQLYYYMLGNGATHNEALKHFTHRAMEKSIIPSISHMAMQVVGVSPLLLWGMLLGGMKPVLAVGIQVLMLLAMLCSSLLSVVITLYVARRFAFDAYLQLKRKNS